ncbi:MAG: NOL1/NOP2/sun family putative RNA methylase [Candidatus Nanoarchaeia archaeon]|nr:NOL1/NOP2/sun family putative RNA methylase [Candidatus Nanoarchaeia archaeon]|tara:strand:+ start:81907 stop:82797 length:891 start_codon:yes stop_codon:yes gene_type:complete
MEWKQKFLDRYEKLTDLDEFVDISSKPLRKSLRVNTLKTNVKEIKSRFKDHNLEKIPWCKEGFWLKGQVIGNTLEHFLGYIYLQEAASMIPPIVLDPKDEIVLDMCASPGSKTTQLSSLMKNKGLIVANDININRLKPLSINLQRCGVSNVIMTKMEGRFFKQEFDKILVDAPCSGIGTIRKSPNTPLIWNPNAIKRIAGIQRQLLFTAFNILKQKGTLVYSTCTLEPEENEGVINSLLEKYDDAKLEKINLDIKRSPAILEFENKKYNEEIKKCLRIWPQDNDTEGFFVAKITKE